MITSSGEFVGKVLFAPDRSYAKDPMAFEWLCGFINELATATTELTVVLRDFDSSELEKAFESASVNFVKPMTFGEDTTDETGVLPRYHARQVVRLATAIDFDVVLVQGIELSRYVAGSGRFARSLWCLVDDRPELGLPLDAEELAEVEKIAGKTRIILAVSHRNRAQIDNHCPTATSKVRVLPRIRRLKANDAPRLGDLKDNSVTYHIDYHRVSDVLEFVDFGPLVREMLNQERPPRVIVNGLSEQDYATAKSTARVKKLSQIPGITFEFSSILLSELAGEHHFLIRFGEKDFENSFYEEVVLQHGFKCLQLTQIPRVIDFSRGLETQVSPLYKGPKRQMGDLWTFFTADLPDYNQVPMQEEKVKVLFVGADFKFAGDIVDLAMQRSDIIVRADILNSNGRVQSDKSLGLLEWADVVIVEFASQNAVWYSQNVSSRQKLIVHLHGYELYSSWIGELDIDKTFAIVVASDFYRSKVLELTSWPSHKVRVIPNSVRFEDLSRPKNSDAKFHLGMVGIVPILKRPDRALDLLEILLKHDNRFTLHFKGHFPWNYQWEWNKAAHQDSYRSFFKRLGFDPILSSHVAFEPFGPDIGNWLSKVGWILSPSTRETFHMAAIEGACSGAVPLVWRREGSDEIIGTEFNYDSTEEIANKILEVISREQAFENESQKAISFAEKYSVSNVRNLWLNLVFEPFDSGEDRVDVDVASVDIPEGDKQLLIQILTQIEDDEIGEALDVLNERIKQTVGKHGPLKDTELFVRGVSAIDNFRFDLLQTASAKVVGNLENLSILLVEERSGGKLDLEEFQREENRIEIAPPLRFLGSDKDGYEFDSNSDQEILANSGEIRFDRWVEFCKIKIHSRMVKTGANCVVVRGAWWAALPTVLACNQLGVNVGWILDNIGAKQIAKANMVGANSSDIVSQVVAKMLPGFSGLFLLPSMEEEWESLKAQFDGVVVTKGTKTEGTTFANLEDLSEKIASARPRQIRNNFSGVPKPISELNVLLHGFTGLIDAGTVRIDILSLNDSDRKRQLKSADLFIIDGDLLAGAPTKANLAFLEACVQEARQFAVPSCMVYRGLEKFPPELVSLTRKMDSISVSHPENILKLLELNPLHVMHLSYWSELDSFESNVVLAARSCKVQVSGAIPVENASANVSKPLNVRPNQSFKLGPTSVAVESLDSEKISVIIATYKGKDRIRAVLQDLREQTLPMTLIEVLVVENGTPDGTIDVVSEFIENSSLTVKYFYESFASAGNARNRGLIESSGKYITFVDDDDRLESNYLKSMWLSADDNCVVVGGLSDLNADGVLIRDTPNNARLEALHDSRVPLAQRSGLLFMNSCKLIPKVVLRDIRYDPDLRSGEDVVFMSELLKFEDLVFVPAAKLPEADYVRVLRANSISRQASSFDFSVVQRVDVLNALERLKLGILPQSASRAIEVTQHAQASFIRKFRKENPADEKKVIEYLERNLLKLSPYVKLK